MALSSRPISATNLGSNSHEADTLSLSGCGKTEIELASLTPANKMLSNSLCVCVYEYFPTSIYIGGRKQVHASMHLLDESEQTES